MQTTKKAKQTARTTRPLSSANPISSRRTLQRFSSVIPQTASFFFTLIAGLLLYQTAIFTNLLSTIIALGLDEQRAQFIAAFLMAVGAALTGGFAGKRKIGATLAAGFVFGITYLNDFIYTELRPAFDPLGNLEPLNTGALINTACVMVALALLCGFVGAVVGVALNEVLLSPLYHLLRFFRQRYAERTVANRTQLQQDTSSLPEDRKIRRDVIWSTLGAFAFITLVVFSSSATDLFVYSPDVGLHLPPIIHNAPVRKGTIVRDTLVSAALGEQKKQFLVYLPPSYFTRQGQTKRYPTLYLLHGSPGGDSNWFTGGKADQSADTLIALGKIPELILILPDGNGRLKQTSEWGNSFDHHQNMETYIANDLVKYVDANYRTIADAAHRAIGGLSMGGFGATNIAIHHPDVFGYVISLGGYYRAEGSIWGNNAAYMRANSPIEVLPNDKQAWRLRMYIGAGTRDQPFYNDAKQFVQELSKLHIAYQLDIVNGAHSWGIWQLQLFHALLWLKWGS